MIAGEPVPDPPHAGVDSFLDEDDVFDARLPRKIRVKSSIHFTPMSVAREAARWLAPDPGMLVLDIGAGPGKFCLTAAHERPRSTFVGVELRPHLIRTARRLAVRLAVPNVRFIDGDALSLDWSSYDAFYLYNPFAEQLHEPWLALDRTLELRPDTYLRYTIGVYERLDRARVGTRVVTYHGFGAPLPPGYECVAGQMMGTGRLELWIRRAPTSRDHEEQP